MPDATYFTVLDPYPPEYEDCTTLAHFWQVLREQHKMITTKCNDCGQIHWPPRVLCPNCLSTDIGWVDMPETAKIYSYTIAYGGLPPELADKAPVVCALIDFPNGVRMLTSLVDTKPEEVETGMEVKLSVGKIAPDFQGRERVIPYFTLSR